MEKDDARKLSSAEQHVRRRQVIRSHKRGRTRTQIAQEVGLSYTAVSKTIERFEALGMAGLAPRTCGRRSGEDRALSVEQEQAVQRTICDHRPAQLKMDFALWSRAAVMQLIEREYGIKLHVRSVGKYLARWGFTPQKPIKRAYEQSPAVVKEWLDTQYPQIAQRAKAEGAEVHWGDETALLNTDVRDRSFAPKGQSPVAVGGTRQKLIHDRPGQQARAVQNLLPRSVRQTHRMKLLSGRINRVFFHGSGYHFSVSFAALWKVRSRLKTTLFER